GTGAAVAHGRTGDRAAKRPFPAADAAATGARRAGRAAGRVRLGFSPTGAGAVVVKVFPTERAAAARQTPACRPNYPHGPPPRRTAGAQPSGPLSLVRAVAQRAPAVLRHGLAAVDRQQCGGGVRGAAAPRAAGAPSGRTSARRAGGPAGGRGFLPAGAHDR